MAAAAMRLLALGALGVLVACFIEGRWISLVLSWIVVAFPIGLILLAVAGQEAGACTRFATWGVLALGSMLLVGITILVLGNDPAWGPSFLRFPFSAAWMLIGLGLVPLLLVGWLHAVTFVDGTPPGDSREADVRRGPAERS